MAKMCDMPEGEYCRACGYDRRPDTETPEWMRPPPEGTLARVIWDARGGPPPPMMGGFA